jgi:hypothetical protein
LANRIVLGLSLALISCASKPAPQQAPAEATVVFSQIESGAPRLFAAGESTSAKAVALTPAGVRAAYCGSIARRVLWAQLASDATVVSLHEVALDGSGDVALGDLPAAKYRSARGAWAVGGLTVVQLPRADGSGPELLAARNGGLTRLAQGRYLGAFGDRVAYLASASSASIDAGDVRSMKSDGSGDVALGGGEGKDLFHGITGGMLVLTVNGASPEVRAVSFDGSELHSRSGSVGLLFSRGSVVAAHGAGFEVLDTGMSASPLRLPVGANVLAVLDDGRVAAHVAGTGVVAADSRGSQLLDGFAAGNARGAHQVRDRLVYTANGAAGSFLRSARVDGSAAVTLAEGHGQEILFTSALPQGRVLFYRTNGVEPGGWLASAKLDGGDERLLGDDASGTRHAADHDFGAVLGSGRLVFEAELQEGQKPRLYVMETMGEVRTLTAAGSYATLSAVLE